MTTEGRTDPTIKLSELWVAREGLTAQLEAKRRQLRLAMEEELLEAKMELRLADHRYERFAKIYPGEAKALADARAPVATPVAAPEALPAVEAAPAPARSKK